MMKLILRNFLSPGDIVMLTAAVRDLHRCYPDKFLTDVRTSCIELWQNNPFITRMDENDPEARSIECYYPLIHQSNRQPYHFIHGFIADLNDKLGLNIRPTEFRGDIHLSVQEKTWPSQIREVLGEDIPFWIVNAGGKHDFTTKWWESSRYQKVVDHFRGRVLFIQVGQSEHHHPALDGVIDLRGCTKLRHLVRLVVSCPGGLVRRNVAHALGGGRSAGTGRSGRPPMRCCRRGTGALALGSLPPPPIHPHDRGSAMLPGRGLLEIKGGSAWR